MSPQNGFQMNALTLVKSAPNFLASLDENIIVVLAESLSAKAALQIKSMSVVTKTLESESANIVQQQN